MFCNEKTRRAIFRETMSIKTFKKVHGCIRSADKEERNGPGALRDKLAQIRNIYEKWHLNLKVVDNPGRNVTKDEQLVPFHGHCPSRHYIPSKPAIYGIKIWALADSSTWYI